jgi:hypothetical protein
MAVYPDRNGGLNPMTDRLAAQAEELRAALRDLGALWGMTRPLRPAELGRALRLGPEQPGKSVANWLNARRQIPTPAMVAIEMMLLGALPPDGLSNVVLPSPLKGRRIARRTMRA